MAISDSLAKTFKGKRHIFTGDSKTACGLDIRSHPVNVLGPRYAQHATCQRCIRSLRKGFSS